MNGVEQLNIYRREGSEAAFGALARLYGGFVYSIAKRRLSHSQIAEEAAQTVFVRLAGTASRFNTEAELAAWLHRTTLHVSVDMWRNETRRRKREEKAAVLAPDGPEISPDWEEIAPALDDALNRLAEPDRQALFLRFFRQKSMREVGEDLGVNEAAAKMRVGRALERLRKLLPAAQTCSAATLGALLLDRAVEAAPPNLAEALASASLVRLTLGGAPLSPTPLFKSALLIMSKTKIAVAVLALAAIGISLLSPKPRDAATQAPVVRSPSSPGGKFPASPQIATSRGAAGRAEGAQAPAPSLEEAKRALSQMLQNPPHTRSYPPPELAKALAPFAGRPEEALPILLEALERRDNTTRGWALSGVNVLLRQARQDGEGGQSLEPIFAAARPLLSSVLGSVTEPNELRLLALESYTSFLTASRGRFETAAAEGDLLSALKASDKKSQGFPFTIVDILSGTAQNDASILDAFGPSMRSMLRDGDRSQQFLAAYATASWPGEKPAETKAVFLRELADLSPEAHRAAFGLGKLGASAAEAVPLLLEYAKKAADWAGGGYTESALTAACQIDPSLRAHYPAIDAKLKQGESARAAMQNGPVVQVITPEQMVAQLADPEKGQALFKSMLASAGQEGSPENAERAMALLSSALTFATPAQQPAIQAMIDQLRSEAPQGDKTAAEPPRLSVADLLLEARVLLTDNPNPREARIEEALEEFQVLRKEKLTPELLAKVSEAMRKIDPEFQAAWQAQLVKNLPWIDRMLPKK